MIRSFDSTKILICILILIFVNPALLSGQTGGNPNGESIYLLKAGTRILVRMDNGINSKSAGIDDTFTAQVSEPVIVGETAVLPAGSEVEGRVIRATPAGKAGKGGNLEVKFESLRLTGGIKREIDAVLVKKLTARSSRPRNILTVITGTAVGALLGTLIKGSDGVIVGSVIGAGAGTGVVLGGNGNEVGFRADEEFAIELTKSVTLPAEGF